MKAAKPRQVRMKKANHMSNEAFADLKKALEDAVAFERVQRGDLKVTRIQALRPTKAFLR